MKSIYFLLSLLFLTFLFTGCFTKQSNVYYPKKSLSTYINNKTHNNINISKALIEQYKEWKGVRYKYGGTNKSGVDCSYFVQNTFINNLNKKIPRTTLYQSKAGKSISKRLLETGDLVFFITSKKGTRHVGIYLDDGDFMHVSTSKGVIISSLDNPYWKKHYWKAKRVLLD